MASSRDKYRLRIDAFSPASISMARLAEYMGDFARLLGEPESVHLSAVESGSTMIVGEVEPQAAVKVGRRAYRLQASVAKGAAPKAVRRLMDRLQEDRSSGSLSGPQGAKIIEFKIREKTKNDPSIRDSNLDGITISEEGVKITGKLSHIGGQGETISVYVLEDPASKPKKCQSSRELARDMAKYILGPPVRVYGRAKWTFRHGKRWILDQFDIDSFEVLEETDLLETVRRLRNIEGPYKYMNDPVSVLNKIRYGER